VKTSMIGAILFAGLALLTILPVEALDRAPGLCVYQGLVGVRCLGCGMTHAFACVLHGRLASAWAHNPLVIVAFPLVASIAVRDAAVLVRAASRAVRRRLSLETPQS
jgi:hypothetical protein